MLKNCEKCGKKLGNIGHNAHFCSVVCRESFYKVKYRERRREWTRNHCAKKREEGTGGRVACLICGRKFVQVCSHVYARHGMTGREYREAFGLDVKRGIIPPDYREAKARDARDNDMPEMLKVVGRKTRFKKGMKGLGIYHRSEQTRERLSRQFDWFHRKKWSKVKPKE